MQNKKLKSEPLKTVLVITVGFLVIYAIGKWRFEKDLNWALIVSLVVGVAGLLSGYLARKIDFLWMKLALILSYIVPNIILSLVFYLILTPLAWLSKIFGEKNQLDLKNTKPSLFKEHKKVFTKESFEKPW